jgi:hypothetical protein
VYCRIGAKLRGILRRQIETAHAGSAHRAAACGYC